jgi:hypothetical protein
VHGSPGQRETREGHVDREVARGVVDELWAGTTDGVEAGLEGTRGIDWRVEGCCGEGVGWAGEDVL